MICPFCHKEIKPHPMGRPKELDDSQVLALRKNKWTLDRIAKKFGVTKSAIQGSLKRSQK